MVIALGTQTRVLGSNSCRGNSGNCPDTVSFLEKLFSMHKQMQFTKIVTCEHSNASVMSQSRNATTRGHTGIGTRSYVGSPKVSKFVREHDFQDACGHRVRPLLISKLNKLLLSILPLAVLSRSCWDLCRRHSFFHKPADNTMCKDAHTQGPNRSSGRARTGGIGGTNHSHHNIAAELFNICTFKMRRTHRNGIFRGQRRKI